MTAATPTTARTDAAVANCLKAIGGLALWLFAGATFLLLPFTVMASDNCDADDARTICTAAGQQAVAYVPLITAPAATALGMWGLLSRRDMAPLAWIIAMVMLGVTWMVVISIAGI
ncbi:hypothetical protein [Streptomyces luteireticuli]|uniref:Uncharacterized protein n=1 Tax=Streptomyces luteireticuli TaxID=173858 RepID=A0ABP3IZ42_9ACTN